MVLFRRKPMQNQTAQQTATAIAGSALVLLLVVAITVVTRSPQWTTAVAGGLLLAAGFMVMAPCQLQMATSLSVVIKNLAAQKAY